MILRTLGSTFATCLVSAALVACSPPVNSTAEAEAEIEAAPEAANPSALQPSAMSAAAARREARRDASAAGAALPPSGQYKYVDERGSVRLAARLEDIPERQRATATPLDPPAATRSLPDVEERRGIQTADVTIYTTRSCGYCRAAMAHFDELGLDYVNRDIELDEEARAECLELTGGRRGVPVIVVGDAWIQGWSRPAFEKLLASAR